MGTLVKHEGCIDRLSGLPDSVLSHILSFFPTKYAIRTSILSTRWIYLYKSVTTFDFDDDDGDSDYRDFFRRDFLNIVDSVLFSHNTTYIESFRIRCVCLTTDANRICGWISFALQRCVQELHLLVESITDPRDIQHANLFTTNTLVKLVLRLPTFVLTIPTKVCLPNLKTLRLEYVDFIDGEIGIRRLVSGCVALEELAFAYYPSRDVREINISSPSLKRLTMECSDECDAEFDAFPNIVIDAPSLINLEFSFVCAVSCLIVNLKSLVKAHLKYLFDYEDYSLQFAINLLKGISKVQSLSVSPDILRPFTLCGKPLPVFYNLVRLEIGSFFPRVYDPQSWEENELTEFLEHSPNLETIIFVGRAFDGLTLNPSKKVPSCLLTSLKVIEIYSFGGQMKPIEYFLKNSSVLAKLKIQMDLQVEDQLEIAKKLLMLPKELKKCQIEIV